MAISTAWDKDPWASKNAYNSQQEATSAARASGMSPDGSYNVFQTSGGHWHFKPQYTNSGQGVSQQSYQTTYPSQPTQTTQSTQSSNGPGGWDWQSSLRDIASGGHNVGDVVNGWRWDGVKWTQESGGGGEPQPTSADELFNKIISESQSQMDEMTKRAGEFDASNPFNFDEVQARASAGERYNPYYSSELSDMMKGISLRRQSAEGEKSLLSELNQVAIGADKRNLDEAVRASEEGFAGAGLFNSGARERGTGMAQISGLDTAKTREANYGYNQAQIGRQLTGLGTEQATGQRKITAEQTSTIESDVAKQKAEEQARREYEKAQYIGYPYVTSNNSGLQGLLNYAFQS